MDFMTYINLKLKKTKFSVANMDDDVKQLMTGATTLNSIPENNSVTLQKIATDTKQYIDAKQEKIQLQNKVQNSNFDSLANWAFTLASGSATNNELTFTATARLGQAKQVMGAVTTGHQYYVGCYVKTESNLIKLQLYDVGTGNALLNITVPNTNTYEWVSGVVTANFTGNYGIRVLDYRESGWTQIKIKQFVSDNLTERFKPGNEPSKDEFEAMVKKYNNNQLYFTSILTQMIQTDLYRQDLMMSAYTKPIYISKNADVIKVNFKYSDTKDMCVTLQKKGANNLLDFYKFRLIDNSSSVVSKDFTAGTEVLSSGTDWLGPYKVLAVNNANGDNPSSVDFTGGNHAYNGDSTGSVTATTYSEPQLFVDGRKVDTYTGFATCIDIYWSNNVQASNTKKIDGTGRHVLQENYHLHFDGFKWTVNNQIQFLEDVIWHVYYGLQCYHYNMWDGQVFYHSSPNRKWNTATIASSSGSKRCNRVTLQKNGNYLEVGLNDSIGIGNREFLTTGDGCFTTTSIKTYFNLVGGVGGFSFSANDIVGYEGYYRFYTK